MADTTTRQADRIMASASQSLALQRGGGRRFGSIGTQSRALKRGHKLKKLGRLLLAIGGLWFAASVIGLIIGGIGWTGIILAVLASLIALAVFTRYPRLEVPSLGTIISEVSQSRIDGRQYDDGLYERLKSSLY